MLSSKSKVLIQLGPIALILGLKFALEPNWLNTWGFFELILLGAMFGIFAGFIAKIWD